MGKQISKIQQRKELEMAKAQAYQDALTEAKRAAKAAYIGNQKRKDINFLLQYLALPGRKFQLRCEHRYRTRSYNLGRQMVDFIDHLYGRYSAPLFLYQAMLRPEGARLVYGPCYGSQSAQIHRDHQRWLLTVLRGESLGRAMKGTLTNSEAHWFLRAPVENSINQNLFWAKCAAAGVPRNLCGRLTRAFDLAEFQDNAGDRLGDILRFFARYGHKFDGDALWDMTFFLRAVVRNRRFSFAGRTYKSLDRIRRVWERTGYSGFIEEPVSWRPFMGAIWETFHSGYRTRVVELANSRSLAEEGEKQHHCVFTYEYDCKIGSSRIMSMRTFLADREEGRLTIEVDPDDREIVQVRGFANRGPRDDEMKILRRWARDYGLVVAGC